MASLTARLGGTRAQVVSLIAADMLDDIDFEGMMSGIAGAVNGVVEQLATMLSPAINAIFQGGKVATNWAIGIFEALPVAAEHRNKTHRVSQQGGISSLLAPDEKWLSYLDPTSLAEIEVYNVRRARARTPGSSPCDAPLWMTRDGVPRSCLVATVAWDPAFTPRYCRLTRSTRPNRFPRPNAVRSPGPDCDRTS